MLVDLYRFCTCFFTNNIVYLQAGAKQRMFLQHKSHAIFNSLDTKRFWFKQCKLHSVPFKDYPNIAEECKEGPACSWARAMLRFFQNCELPGGRAITS
jgi:hypothetical protein